MPNMDESCARRTVSGALSGPIGRRIFIATAGAGAFALAASAFAQSRSATVTLIVPEPAGGALDGLGRLVADSLSGLMDTRIRVENVVGDSGVAGVNAIAAAPGDGSVLGLLTSSALIGGRLLSRNAQFNPSQDFQWLTILGSYSNAMILSTRSNYTTFNEWLAFAHRSPVPLVYATFGTGTAGHLAGAYLRYNQGANLTHVSVASEDDGYAMLSDGRIDVLFDGLPNALVKVSRSGHRIIAITAMERSSSLPDCPAFGEMFHESFLIWIGLALPRTAPPPVYVRFASAVSVLVSEQRYVDSLRAAGLQFMGLSGSGTRAYVESEFLRVAKLIARLNDEGMRR